MTDTPEELLATLSALLRETERRCKTPYDSSKVHLMMAAMLARACAQDEQTFRARCAEAFHAARSTQESRWLVGALLNENGAELVAAFLRGEDVGLC